MVTSNYTLFSLRLWRLGGAALLGSTLLLTLASKGMCDAPVPTPGPCIAPTELSTCVPVPRDENESYMRVDTGYIGFNYLGWACVGMCYPCTCPENDVQNVIGVMMANVMVTPTPPPAGTPTPLPESYVVIKSSKDEDYWWEPSEPEGCQPASDEARSDPEPTQLVRKDLVGTTLVTGVVSSLSGNPEGCPIYRSDAQTPRSRGYIHVFNVDYTITPNGEGGLDLTYSINQPSFNASYPPCQTPFVHDVDIDITDNNGNYVNASDTTTLSGWTDTWEWDGHFTVGDVDWNQCDNIDIHFGGLVAGFEVHYVGGEPPYCVEYSQADASFGKTIYYPMSPPCDDTTQGDVEYITGVPVCEHDQQTAVCLWSRDDDCGNRLELWCEPVGTSAAYILRYNGKPIHCCLYGGGGNFWAYFMTENCKRFHSTYSFNADLSPLGSSGDEGTFNKYDWTVYSYDCICDRWVPSTPHDYPLCFESIDIDEVGTEDGDDSPCEDCNDLNLD